MGSYCMLTLNYWLVQDNTYHIMSESNIEIKMKEVSNVEKWASHCKAPIREMVLLYWIIYIAILFLISEIIGIFKTIIFAYSWYRRPNPTTKAAQPMMENSTITKAIYWKKINMSNTKISLPSLQDLQAPFLLYLLLSRTVSGLTFCACV